MYNPNVIEKKWQDKWAKSKIFEADPVINKKKIFITIPYPYASGPLHIGHGRSYVNGDIFTRFYRAKGYNVLLPMAFHITGTPVLAVSSSIAREDKETIERMREYISLHTPDKNRVEKLVQSFKDPWNIVKYFSDKIKFDFKSIGMSIDWRREFTTGDKEYNKFIEWQYHHLKEEGYIEKGEYPILFCPRDKNAVGEDDISSGDELDLNINEFICIKFPYKDGYLVASTLRPETIYGITNMWINPEGDYVKVEIDKEFWYISEDAVYLLKNQNKDVKILNKFKGIVLIGEKAYDVNKIKEIPILPGSFVDTSTATGVVYSVPAHAPYDYIALLDLQKDTKQIEKYHLSRMEIELILPIQIINLKGVKDYPARIYCEKYKVESQKDQEKLDMATSDNYKDEFYSGILNEKCGKYHGLLVSEAAQQVSVDLINESKADKLYIPVTKNLECKCGATIIVSILKDQWFLNFNAGGWKDKAFKCLDKMEIIPHKYRLNFENIFNWLEKRPCARKRGLGTKLPFNKDWIIESLSDSTIYMAFYTIIHKIKEYKIKLEQLTLEFFDFVFLGKGSGDTLSEKTNINTKILEEIQEEFLYWYPVDHRHTAIMHISNHLSFFIFHHAAIFPEKHWPKKVSLMEPLIREGQKMGKSKGNIISLADIQNKYSADLFRFYISHSADLGVKLDWIEKKIQTLRGHILKFYTFIIQHSNGINVVKGDFNNIQSKYSKVVLSLFLKNIENARESLNDLNLRRYLQLSFYETFNLLQEFYRISKFDKDKQEVAKIVFPLWIQILSFTMPHICEELWEKLGNEQFLSNAPLLMINSEYIRDDLEEEFAYIKNLVEDVLNIKKIIKSVGIEGIYIYTAPKWKYDLKNIIYSKKGNFKNIMNELKNKKEYANDKRTISFIKNQIKDRIWENKLSQIDEVTLLNEYLAYIEARVSDKIIINSDFDPQQRSDKAEPLKPAIYIKSTK